MFAHTLALPLAAINFWEGLLILAYLLLTAYLGWLGYRRTRTAADYLIGGRKTHPFIMSLSYGATFISTSAIVGFGGVAGLFGMSLLWLTFLNIFVGIFIAFVVLGPRVRSVGHRLDAHTFPELLGRRYQSKTVQVMAGAIIALFIPLYTSAVLIGGTEFISTQFEIDYGTALVALSVLMAAYVMYGGLKGVMYTDAMQGCVMFVGMAVLLIVTYIKVGGVNEGHATLGGLAALVPGSLKGMGHEGWTAMPTFGWGDKKFDLWWIVVSTIVMGVGIGVLAQPQLAVRFMTVRSKRDLNRAVAIGGIFILMMTGVAFTVGALSNAYFALHGPPLTGRVVKPIEGKPDQAVIQVMAKDDSGAWKDKMGKDGKGAMAPVVLLPDGENSVAGQSVMVDGQPVPLVQGRSISIVYAGGNPDQIIPTYISRAMPRWFGAIFLLTLLAAAMSTLSSQLHTMGASVGRDVYEQLTAGSQGSAQAPRNTILVVRMGIIVGIIVAMTIGYYARGGYIVARATAIFFGLCASAFLPAYIGGLLWKRATRPAALASMIVGFLSTAFWLLMVKEKEAGDIGLVQMLTGGSRSILMDSPNWPVVDPIVVATPLSLLTLVVVSLLTAPPDAAHVQRCFGTGKSTTR